MSNLETIKSECKFRGQVVLWEDPDFPATQSSVFYHQTPPFVFSWLRPMELFQSPAFVMNSANRSLDIAAGKMGDQWLVSCFVVLYKMKKLFYRVVPGNQTFGQDYCGVFRFRIWWCGEWVEVLIDDRLPTINGRLAFLHCDHSEQLWPALLEKAYAKLHGSYEALKYGNILDGLADFTGGVPVSLPLTDVADLPELIRSVLKTTTVVTCVRKKSSSQEQLFGISADINYVISCIETIETNDSPLTILRLLDQDENEKKGVLYEYVSYLEEAVGWMSLSQSERDELCRHRGIWMLLGTFKKIFSHLELVYLDSETSRDEPFLSSKESWHMAFYNGSWRKGVTAGGCKNSDFLHLNPQVRLYLPEPETLVVSLHQNNIMEPRVIGYSIYSLKKHSYTEKAPASYFEKTKSTFSSLYTNSRQVNNRFKLDRGDYILVPTTLNPREEARFVLRVVSKLKLGVHIMNTEPKMLQTAIVKAPTGLQSNSFSQYEAMFFQLADEHKTIDPFDLLELLEACLPNDYIKSCASLETCRNIVLTLDSTSSGRISLLDFKDLLCTLKHWHGVFGNHSKEKMGVLKIERLKDALREVGFEVCDQALALLLLRYSRKDGLLRFCDFVSAVLHMYRSFTKYVNDIKSRGLNSNNTSVSQWLICSLKC